jgi:hypothetical protein
MPFTTKLTALHAALADADLGEGSGHPQVGCYAKELRTVPLTTGRLLSDDATVLKRYKDATDVELVGECTDRGLSGAGDTAALIARLRRSDSYGITEPSDCKDFVAGADISFLDSDDRKVTTLSYPALAGKLLADDIMPEGIPLAQSGGGWQAVVGKGMHALGLRQFAARAYRVIDEKSAADKAAADTASAAAAAAATAAAEAARLAALGAGAGGGVPPVVPVGIPPVAVANTLPARIRAATSFVQLSPIFRDEMMTPDVGGIFTFTDAATEMITAVYAERMHDTTADSTVISVVQAALQRMRSSPAAGPRAPGANANGGTAGAISAGQRQIQQGFADMTSSVSGLRAELREEITESAERASQHAASLALVALPPGTDAWRRKLLDTQKSRDQLEGFVRTIERSGGEVPKEMAEQLKKIKDLCDVMLFAAQHGDHGLAVVRQLEEQEIHGETAIETYEKLEKRMEKRRKTLTGAAQAYGGGFGGGAGYGGGAAYGGGGYGGGAPAAAGWGNAGVAAAGGWGGGASAAAGGWGSNAGAAAAPNGPAGRGAAAVRPAWQTQAAQLQIGAGGAGSRIPAPHVIGFTDQGSARLLGQGERKLHLRGKTLADPVISVAAGGTVPNTGNCFYCGEQGHSSFECKPLRDLYAQGLIDAQGHPV